MRAKESQHRTQEVEFERLTIGCFSFWCSEERIEGHDGKEGEYDHDRAKSEDRADNGVGEGFDLKLSDLYEDLKKKSESASSRENRKGGRMDELDRELG